MDELAPGTVVAGRFRIEGVLGSGGMGVVYRAVQEALDREVALKVVRAEHAANDVARRRFLREARVAAALRHPNAVEIYDFGESDDALYLAMEMLRGHSLRSIVDFDLPPLEVRNACRIGRQIADVLTAAASIQLVHRDLKPENVMIESGRDGDERVVVVDFGLAFRGDHTADTGRITRDGMASGTPDYMSPEQARGTTCTPATDIYALGCIVYEMLTAQSPIATNNPAMTMMRHLFTVPTPMREAFPALEIPAELDELTSAMLRKNPDERPKAAAVRDVLARFERGQRERLGGAVEDGRPLGRAARMMSIRPTAAAPTPVAVKPAVVSARLGVVGLAPSDDVLAPLMAHGFEVVGDIADADVLLVDGRRQDDVERLAKGRIPVVADVDPTDAAALAQLLRLGVAEVIPRPLDGALLVRRLERAIRKAHR